MTVSTFSGLPETWTRLPIQTLFSLSKHELDDLQLHWAQKRFMHNCRTAFLLWSLWLRSKE